VPQPVDRLATMPNQSSPVKAASSADAEPEYGAFYYRHDCGIPYERNEHWLNFFGDIAEGLVRNLHPTSFLDAGCAMGFLVEAMHQRGVDAWGVDVSEYAISQVDESVRDRCRIGSLTEPLERRYDLIACIEVLEHIPATETDKVIANLCAATDHLLLSSTPADYGEPTHLNVQPPETWSALLAREGFFRDLEQDFSYLAPWAALYRRVDEPTPETVRRYDRSWWRLRHEAFELRRSLLATQKTLAELEEADSAKNPPRLAIEIDRLKEENLRLRDLLIGKDAELGTVRGRLAVAEDQSRRLANLATRIQARIPGAVGVTRVGTSALRKIQSRRG
jgi:SAM-dependent methyltransferase